MTDVPARRLSANRVERWKSSSNMLPMPRLWASAPEGSGLKSPSLDQLLLSDLKIRPPISMLKKCLSLSFRAKRGISLQRNDAEKPSSSSFRGTASTLLGTGSGAQESLFFLDC